MKLFHSGQYPLFLGISFPRESRQLRSVNMESDFSDLGDSARKMEDKPSTKAGYRKAKLKDSKQILK